MTEVLPEQRRARANTRSFAFRNFRLWAISQGVSMVGYFAQVVSQSLLVLELTGSASMLGVVAALQFLPSLSFGAWAGVLSDRVSKWRLMIVTQAAGAVLAVSQGVLVLAGVITTPLVLVIATLSGTAWAFDQPSRRTIVTELVDEPAAPNAVNLNGALNNCAKVIGPTVAGVLLSVGDLGWCFVFNGVTSVVGVAGLLAMDRSNMNVASPIERAPGQIMEGIRYVWRDGVLRRPIAMIGIVTLMSFNWSVLLPLLVRRELSAADSAYTLLFGAMSVGGVVGSMWLAGRPEPSPALLRTSSAGFGTGLIILGFSPNALWATIASVEVGFASMVYLNATVTIVQLTAEPTVRGRVMALFGTVLLGAMGLGGLLAGWLAESLGTRFAFGLGGITAVAAAAVKWPVIDERSGPRSHTPTRA